MHRMERRDGDFMDKVQTEILPKFPLFYRERLAACSFLRLCEIRFRAQRPVMLYYHNRKKFLSIHGGETNQRSDAVIAGQEDIASIVNAFCKGSVYAYQNYLKDGFIPLCGGHRIGISGKAVMDGERIINVEEFSGVNIRIAKEFIGSADSCMPHIYDCCRLSNTVIISPPGYGKTTVLRDIARQLSENYKVVIVDERSELAASSKGVPQFDIGDQTDVLEGFPKPMGMLHALRSLSPDVIVTDEIGTEADLLAISALLKGGCKIITSMHGYSIDEALLKKRKLMEQFDTAILLGKVHGIPEVVQCRKL